ncbi:hypothetical protein KIW84_055520 [Lathyrus oleraceus]|uniref:Uncharacterized protein n=1 Tax=Pisum sativum TaxID=3888 RepID=A0A9D4WVX1_PEA|nr:hypothetical protein KIW84_055520 [Pisum sativum]
MVVTYKDWHEMVPFALHGYRTSVRTSIGATPFSLVYGMEAVLPVELNLIEEKRLTAMCHGQLYQQRMKKAFDKKAKPRVFREGDLVLKKVLSFTPDSRGKCQESLFRRCFDTYNYGWGGFHSVFGKDIHPSFLQQSSDPSSSADVISLVEQPLVIFGSF